jgi:hypothetical protein
MRDFRDAKAMARALRDALKAKAIETTHAETLELVAKTFGYENWNILSAKIEAAEPAASDERVLSVAAENKPAPPKTLYCSFCGKSQADSRACCRVPIQSGHLMVSMAKFYPVREISTASKYRHIASLMNDHDHLI